MVTEAEVQAAALAIDIAMNGPRQDPNVLTWMRVARAALEAAEVARHGASDVRGDLGFARVSP